MESVELKMYRALKKNVKVTCVDGQVITGLCTDYTQPIDNEPEIAEMCIARGPSPDAGLIAITEPEIKKIEYLD